MKSVPLACCCLCLLLLLLLAGCGSNKTTPVTGTVTLDGKPLPNATVVFRSEAGGFSAFGSTDAEGVYVLRYTQDLDGTPPGQYRVSVSTYDAGDADAEPPIPQRAEQVPAKYNSPTELTRTVADGANTIDIELDSSAGPIVQPKKR